METRVDQIADRIYRISTSVPEVAPGGFTFNQFLIDADEPLLYHTGMRALFPAVRAAVERVLRSMADVYEERFGGAITTLPPQLLPSHDTPRAHTQEAGRW